MTGQSHQDLRRILKRMEQWWDHTGFVLGSAVPFYTHEQVQKVLDPEEVYMSPEDGASHLYQRLQDQRLSADMLPLVDTDLGPGSLAVYLGCKPESTNGSVWFHSAFENKNQIEDALKWDRKNIWWERTERLFSLLQEYDKDRLIIPIPDLCENIDVLASLRGAENLMMDMLDDPGWVSEMVLRIDGIYEQCYKALLPYVMREDGTSSFHAFRLWGRGKVAKLQCDASAMISRDMFESFVIPSLSRQCRFLDKSLYHLDGTQSMQHLDALLQIEELDGIEWTPQAGIETGEHPRWYPMYRKIRDAGKSVQILVGSLEHVDRLLEEIGTDGVYLLSILDYEEFLRLQEIVAPYYV